MEAAAEHVLKNFEQVTANPNPVKEHCKVQVWLDLNVATNVYNCVGYEHD